MKRSMTRVNVLLIVALALGTLAAVNPVSLLTTAEEVRTHDHKEDRRARFTQSLPQDARVTDANCVEGMAGPFPCEGLDLMSYVPITEFAGDTSGIEANPLADSEASDIWGWTDPDSGDEYVIIGKTNGAGFFRVTDPSNPVYLGAIENTSEVQLIWFDIKVHANHAYIVSESGLYGMQVFDLTRLREVTEPQDFSPDFTYPLTYSAHNVAINTDTAFAYVVGGNNALVAQDQCRSGIQFIDLADPAAPTFAGCYLQEGGNGTAGGVVTNNPVGAAGVTLTGAYVHDVQCVTYDGPDSDHTGREICAASAENHVSFIDVTDKLTPTLLSTFEYDTPGYTHQGWFTEDQAHFLLGDETDETGVETVTNTRTIVIDTTDLDAPTLAGYHFADTEAIDHNMYVRDGRVYQSNYAAGLRVLGLDRVAEGVLEEQAFFDVFPEHDDAEFVGTWSNYPYFESGTIAVSGYEGLFLLQPSAGGPLDDQQTQTLGVSLARTGSTVTLSIPSGAAVEDDVVVQIAGGPADVVVPAGCLRGDGRTVACEVGSDDDVTFDFVVRPLGLTDVEVSVDGMTETVPAPAPASITDSAVRVSEERFASTSQTSDATLFAPTRRAAQHVVLSRNDVFADALGGSVLTAEGPLVFTASDGLTEATLTEVDRVLGGEGTVYVLGGTGAVDQSVADALTQAGYDVVRLEGPTRIETALAVADRAESLFGVAATVAVARADAPESTPTAAWADAVTAGGWAADTSNPVLLTPTSAAHPAVTAWLAERDVEIVVVGGEDAIAQSTADALGADRRVAGSNRFGTAAEIARTLWTIEPAGYLVTPATTTDGWGYALAAAGLAADLTSPILLAEADRLPDETDGQTCADGTRAVALVVSSLEGVGPAVRAALAGPC